MSLYDECLSVVESSNNTELLSKPNSFDIANNTILENADDLSRISIYYISDVHLEHQICRKFPTGATNAQVKVFIEQILSNMLTDDIVLHPSKNIVLFGGDIASSFNLSEIFFSRLIKIWDQKSKLHHHTKRKIILYPCQKKQEIRDKLDKWKNKHKWTWGIVLEDLLNYPEKRVPTEIKDLISKYIKIKTFVDNTIEHGEGYYFEKWKAPIKNIYSVLGNHELWDFKSLRECTEAYQNLFDKLEITFLNNNGKYIWDNIYINNVGIIGGIGFAGYNELLNANSGFYRGLITREQEIMLTKEWEAFYNKAVESARAKKSFLIVLTHNPPYDWKSEKNLDSNCLYFYGHDHKNRLFFTEETNTYVFADNQIGYEAKHISMKKAVVWAKSNPFVYYDDGISTITSEDYLYFNRFKGIHINGTRRIEQCIKNGAKFYMIKEMGYYCFFVICSSNVPGFASVGTFICVGGVLKKISDSTEICYYHKNFLEIVNTYLEILSPYRYEQEKISKLVKSFGGTGNIHGYIIDIDFYNHIMLNPEDGKVTFYYSPIYGSIKAYNTLYELLANHNRPLLDRYAQKADLPTCKNNDFIFLNNKQDIGFITIDIKNSQYSGSRKMNQLQRLFDAKILRDWNDELLTIPKKTTSPKNKSLNKPSLGLKN